ncbi:MAG: YgjV family protein [Clostridiales bacterium]|nr:YgjV family protein [Clostridiales bacterium]
MEPIRIFYQAIGFIGTAFMIASYRQRERNNNVRCQLCAGAVFAIHHFLFGA